MLIKSLKSGKMEEVRLNRHITGPIASNPGVYSDLIAKLSSKEGIHRNAKFAACLATSC
jgi:hypothetical protein